MAIGTLTPKIRICTKNNCATLKILESTGNVSTANPGGWFGTNEDPANITAASLSYTTPSDTTPTIVDVLATINAQTSVSIDFLLAELDITPEDGLYSFEYILTAGGQTVTYRTSIFSLCVVRCCVDKLWAKVATNALSEDCKCTGEKTPTLEKAELAEGLYNSILRGASCNSTSIKNELLKKLQRICKLENCNCK